MAMPTLVITPSETRDRNGPVPLTESGAVRRVSFDGGQAFFVEEGTTNLIPNPNANVSTSAWTALGSPTLTRDTSETIVGEQSVRIDADGSSTYQGIVVNTVGGVVSAGEVWTASAWFKGPPGLGFRILLREDSGGELTAQRFDTTGEWQRISVTRTLTAPSSYVHLRIDNNHSASTAYTAWVSGLQIEQKPYATTYADGSLGEGYSWAGPPNGSPSVRQPSYAFATHLMPLDEGSVYIRWQAENIPAVNQFIGGLGIIGGVDEVVLLAHIATNDNQVVRTRPNYHSHGPLLPTDKAHRNVYVEYTKETTASDFREGGGRIERGRAFPDSPWSADRVAVGFSGNVSPLTHLPINGYVAALIAYDTPLTEAEIAWLDAIPTSELTWANLMPKIGGVRTVHDPAPFAVRSIHEEV